MPSSTAFCTAGATAEASCARTISALAPCAIRLSMSVNCFCADDCASAEMYLSPAAAIAALMAASSVFQRSSWKFDQDTPTTLSLAWPAAAKDTDSAAPASTAVAIVLMMTLPVPGAHFCAPSGCFSRVERYCVSLGFVHVASWWFASYCGARRQED